MYIMNLKNVLGGPLIDAKENVLVGIFSFLDGDKNCTDYPQVFTNVAIFRAWISETSGLNLTNNL